MKKSRKRLRNNNRSWDGINNIFQQMEIDLIVSMKKNLTRHEKEEMKQGFKFEQWQAAKLRDMERFRAENHEIIGSYEPEIEQMIQSALIDTYDKGVKLASDSLIQVQQSALDNNISVALPNHIQPVVEPHKLVPSESVTKEEAKQALKEFEMSGRVKEEIFFRTNDDKLKALIRETKKTVADPTKAILRYQDDQYRRVIARTQIALSSGNLTLTQAIDRATADYLRAGITNIEYKNGKRVNIADYVTMCLRTANHKAFLHGQGAKRMQIGITTVLVSQHLTACPLCVPWQNEILIDDIFSGGTPDDGPYQLLSEAVAEGLLHVNCQHNLNTFYPGISTKPPSLDPSKVDDAYKETQKQRRLERAIRRQKRVVAGTTDLTNFNNEKRKLEELENRLLNGDASKTRVKDVDIKKTKDDLMQKAIDDRIEETRRYIKSDKCIKKIHDGKQGKHIVGHNNYGGKSYLADGVDPQKLVDKYQGTGDLKITNPTKNWIKKEFVFGKDIMGFVVDEVSGKVTPTRYFSIHYSKKGTHIVPRKEPSNGKSGGNEKSRGASN
ncbi:Phage minor capsid protein 2 [Peptostreptococcus russellii]|uniref:Phage minor capsid protein 2 n=1 Tax=Peptostreptococcus russellii TaxID=215200 RepID=A0A1H8KFS8_9FIRM|nr:phage minor capsid protein [Peptostreptococcus russellii]SEN91833.1 Phage minor capsid protein 2 [Peptostreptococcus russellii]